MARGDWVIDGENGGEKEEKEPILSASLPGVRFLKEEDEGANSRAGQKRGPEKEGGADRLKAREKKLPPASALLPLLLWGLVRVPVRLDATSDLRISRFLRSSRSAALLWFCRGVGWGGGVREEASQV